MCRCRYTVRQSGIPRCGCAFSVYRDFPLRSMPFSVVLCDFPFGTSSIPRILRQQRLGRRCRCRDGACAHFDQEWRKMRYCPSTDQRPIRLAGTCSILSQAAPVRVGCSFRSTPSQEAASDGACGAGFFGDASRLAGGDPYLTKRHVKIGQLTLERDIFVESRCGAVALGSACLFPSLSSDGA